ncbi:MAG: hypothetical protein IKG58_02325 [Bacilli bacterium]|nr:hypothetical protein [Bacilli bacterium]
MRSRMERYHNEENHDTYSRSNKNQDLYENLGKNTRYTSFSDITSSNVFDIDEAKQNITTRQGYQQMKEYDDMIAPPKMKKELDEFNYLYQDRENRVYDINSALKEARENRIERDELEDKRKLKNTNYNILASLNKEELEKYRKEKVERTKPDEDELQELINTITSKTLAGEIDKKASLDLLSDLMATDKDDEIEGQKPKEDDLELSKEILDKEQLDKVRKIKEDAKEDEEKSEEKEGIMKNADEDFYTRSMDLSDKDFDLSDIGDKKMPVLVKILLFLIIVAVLAGVGFFVYKNFM